MTDYKSFNWTLASFYRLGHLYQIFADDLETSERPFALCVPWREFANWRTNA